MRDLPLHDWHPVWRARWPGILKGWQELANSQTVDVRTRQTARVNADSIRRLMAEDNQRQCEGGTGNA